MSALKINVLGSGLIPRGLGLAPREEIFNADRMTIYTILNTHGLTVNYFNPDKKKMMELTKKNLQKVWDKYSEWDGSVNDAKASLTNTSSSVDTTPHVPETVVETKKEEEVSKAFATGNVPIGGIKPINAPDNNTKNNNNNQKNKH